MLSGLPCVDAKLAIPIDHEYLGIAGGISAALSHIFIRSAEGLCPPS